MGFVCRAICHGQSSSAHDAPFMLCCSSQPCPCPALRLLNHLGLPSARVLPPAAPAAAPLVTSSSLHPGPQVHASFHLERKDGKDKPYLHQISVDLDSRWGWEANPLKEQVAAMVGIKHNPRAQLREQIPARWAALWLAAAAAEVRDVLDGLWCSGEGAVMPVAQGACSRHQVFRGRA